MTDTTPVTALHELVDTFRMSAIEAAEVTGKDAADAYEWAARAVEVSLRNNPVVLVADLLIDWKSSKEQTCGYVGCNYYRPSKTGRKRGKADFPHAPKCPVGKAVAT